MQSSYKISPKGVLWTNLLPACEAVLLNNVYLVLLYATRVPPHLLVSVNGKIFTLSVKGATVDGELTALLKFIRRKRIETIFIRLAPPTLPLNKGEKPAGRGGLFTIEQLRKEIRNCILAYPRADIGIATCLTPIKDFCHSVYDTETKNVNLIFDLLPKLQERNAMRDCYHLNLRLTPPHPRPLSSMRGERGEGDNSFELKKYEVNDVYEAIRNSSLVMAT